MKDNIQKTFKEMRWTAKRRKSKWNLLLVPLVIFFTILFSFLYYKLVFLIDSISLIPRDDIVYFFHPYSVWNIFLLFSIGIPSLLLSFIITNLILWFIPPIRKTFEKEAQWHKGKEYKSTQFLLLKYFFMSIFIWFLFIYMFMNTYNALSYKWVVYTNSWYNINEKKYNLSNDLKKIKIEIYKDSSNPAKLSFKFIMNNNKSIEFSEWNEVEFLSKYWEFEQYFKNILSYKIYYNIDKEALNSLLNQPRFKDKKLKNNILKIFSKFNLEYEKLKKYLEENQNDNYFKIIFGFYEILNNKHYKEWISLYSWIHNLNKIEICNDNKCFKKIKIIDFKNIKNILWNKFWNWNYANSSYQRFLISLIYSYIELWDYRKAYYYNGALISEFNQQLNINAYIEYSNIFLHLPKNKVKEYKKYLQDFDRIPWDTILWDIQLYYDDVKNTFYTTAYKTSYYYNQLGLFYKYLGKYMKAIKSYQKAYKNDSKNILTLRNLCIAKYLDTKSKVFTETDKVKYKKEFEESLQYCLSYEEKYEKLYTTKNLDYKFLENIIQQKWDYEILNYIWLNYWFLWKLDLAEKFYKKSLENWWNKVKIYNNLWIIYEDNKDYEKAIQYYKKVLKLDNKNYNTLINISKLYWKLKDYKNAIDYMLSVKKIVSILKYKKDPYNDYLLCKWYYLKYWKQNISWKQYCKNYLLYDRKFTSPKLRNNVKNIIGEQ